MVVFFRLFNPSTKKIDGGRMGVYREAEKGLAFRRKTLLLQGIEQWASTK